MKNDCPRCIIGTLSCTFQDGKIIERCTSCDYQADHVNRRKKQVPIEFTDRRTSNATNL